MSRYRRGSPEPVVVIGAGSTGLGVAGALRRAGVPSVILEEEPVVGSAWRRRYDSLSLNTSRTLSRLPGQRPAFGRGHWMPRDEFVAYLERYARDLRLRVEFGTKVARVSRAGKTWQVETSRGMLSSRSVVVATGPDAVPRLPEWPGVEGFQGEFLHSHEYRNADAYRGKRVLVVGAGDTAADVVLDSVRAGASRVEMSIRTPPFIVRAMRHGIPPDWLALVGRRLPPRIGDAVEARMRRLAVGDLSRYGMPAPRGGFFTQFWKTRKAPIVDRRGFIAALKDGQFGVVGSVEAFDGADVLLGDGSRVRPDVVVAATGYRNSLPGLLGGLGVLRENDWPAREPPGHLRGARVSTPSGSSRSWAATSASLGWLPRRSPMPSGGSGGDRALPLGLVAPAAQGWRRAARVIAASRRAACLDVAVEAAPKAAMQKLASSAAGTSSRTMPA